MSGFMPRPNRVRGLLLIGGLLCLSLNAWSVQRAHLALGSLRGENWQLRGVSLDFRLLADQRLDLELRVARVDAPALAQPLRALRLSCPRLEYRADKINCPAGELRLAAPPFQERPLKFSFSYQSATRAFKLGGARGPLGKFQVEGKWVEDFPQASVNLSQPDLPGLSAFLQAILELPLPTLAGNLELRARLEGRADAPRLSLNAEGNNLSYADAAGSQAGENLALNLELTLNRENVAWESQGQLIFSEGEVYSEPIYFRHQGQPMRLDWNLDWRPEQLNLRDIKLDIPEVGALRAEAELGLGGESLAWRRLWLELDRTNLETLRQRYLDNWLQTQELGDLRFSGTLWGQLDWREPHAHLQLRLLDADLQRQPDPGQAPLFGVSGLSGNFNWYRGPRRTEQAQQTYVRWAGAHFRSKIVLPAGQLHLETRDQSIKLLRPLRLPILDGGLRVENFRLQLGEQPEMEFSGVLQPISMRVLTKTLGLPELGGQLSGMIPSLRYADQRLEIGGALLLKLFDGDIVIHRLSLTRPLDKLPELQAEVDLENLDLHTLTRFFEFGDISGRLSGYVRNLRMLDWQPVAFDAYFATPPDDKSEHAISQKAVNNLSSLGGSDVTAALSRSILRVFESFSYERLGWGCMLRGGICHMRGVEKANNGYYIVKGGGLPRIDVIGYNQHVDWNELLTRLQRITNLKTGAPVYK